MFVHPRWSSRAGGPFGHDGLSQQVERNMTQNLSAYETGATLANEEQPTARLRKGPALVESAELRLQGSLQPLDANADACNIMPARGEVPHQAIEHWCDSFPGMRRHAELFRALHRTDPDA